MHLEIQEQQRQVQRGHVYLSMQILELNAMELERFLNAAAQENPLLEASVPEQRLELEWIGTMPQKYGCRTQRDEQTDTDLPAENGESLEEYLSHSSDYTGDTLPLEVVEVTSMTVGAKLSDGSIDAAICLMPKGAKKPSMVWAISLR